MEQRMTNAQDSRVILASLNTIAPSSHATSFLMCKPANTLLFMFTDAAKARQLTAN
jgi:hypothetical protein